MREVTFGPFHPGYRPRKLRIWGTDSHRLAGMISEADVARQLPDESVAELVEAICADF